jgi:hypothetical protein
MSDPAGHVKTPWTAEQVVALNAWQKRGDVHPFTCGNDSSHRDLLATRDGWQCLDCGYEQDWAHSFMCEKSA